MIEPKMKNSECLCIRALTWFKDSHSLFDYESTKLNPISFHLPLTVRSVSVYRKRESSTVVVHNDDDQIKINKEEYQFLTRFQLKFENPLNRVRIEFYNGKYLKNKQLNTERVNTEESISSSSNREEETYLIVRKIKDINNQQKGYRLEPGQSIKLGRVEYFVSQVKEGGQLKLASTSSKQNQNNYNRKIMKYTPSQKKTETNACKICLQEIQTKEDFLFNPCKCSGSCGTVHFSCLVSWIHFKVKKQINGGTLHFNFNKFECQVCKFELPMIIDVDGEHKELLPIEKPEGNYLILEGACDKVKSVMLIQNISSNGIKLGRGHDCEIRITDISVSRNHAIIKSVGNSFYVFDNKSKFGTLVKENNLNIEIGKSMRGIQVGRTTLNFELRKDHGQVSNRQIKTEGGVRQRIEGQQ